LENKMLVLAMQFSRSLERAPTAISGTGAPQKKDAGWSENDHERAISWATNCVPRKRNRGCVAPTGTVLEV
jgi:hypothetical protein